MNVTNARKVSHHPLYWVDIRMFTQTNTSAPNAANTIKVALHWQGIVGSTTAQTDRLYVLSVANDLHVVLISTDTSRFTLERNHTNVTFVAKPLIPKIISSSIWKFMPELNGTSVQCVVNALL